jgi:hypothetical protein
VQDVAGREAQAALPGRYWLRVAIKSPHVSRRIVGPALTANVGVEMCIAVSDDIEPGYFLFVQIDRDRIDILLAELIVHHCVKKAAGAKILGVPTRPWQRAGDRGRQHDIFGSAKHGRHLPGAFCRWP